MTLEPLNGCECELLVDHIVTLFNYYLLQYCDYRAQQLLRVGSWQSYIAYIDGVTLALSVITVLVISYYLLLLIIILVKYYAILCTASTACWQKLPAAG